MKELVGAPAASEADTSNPVQPASDADVDERPQAVPQNRTYTGPTDVAAPPEVTEPVPEPLDAKKGAKAPSTKIVSKTVATTPSNRARRKIGIGEEVVCSTDPAKDATWSVTGGGAVTPALGNSTTFTASKSPSKSTVKATIGTEAFTADFDVVAPDGLKSTVKSNDGVGEKGPPNRNIGFKTVFDCIVQPNTVAFHRIEFRENIPKDTWTWPDGTADSNGPKEVPWSVGQDNKTTDTVSSGPRPIDRISKGGKFVDFSYTIRVPEDYKNEAGNWVTWLPGEEHYKEYAGADQRGRGTLKATNNQPGGWQGPWK
jgi:hypothetical protein